VLSGLLTLGGHGMCLSPFSKVYHAKKSPPPPPPPPPAAFDAGSEPWMFGCVMRVDA
jgi:hypothetical protein